MANLSVKARESSWGVVHPEVDQDLAVTTRTKFDSAFVQGMTYDETTQTLYVLERDGIVDQQGFPNQALVHVLQVA